MGCCRRQGIKKPPAQPRPKRDPFKHLDFAKKGVRLKPKVKPK